MSISFVIVSWYNATNLAIFSFTNSHLVMTLIFIVLFLHSNKLSVRLKFHLFKVVLKVFMLEFLLKTSIKGILILGIYFSMSIAILASDNQCSDNNDKPRVIFIVPAPQDSAFWGEVAKISQVASSQLNIDLKRVDRCMQDIQKNLVSKNLPPKII